MSAITLIDNYVDKLKRSSLLPFQTETKRNGSSLQGGAVGAELEAKGLCDFEDGGEFDVCITGQRLIQSFKPDTGITRQLIHALRTKNSTKRLCDKSRVTTCILNARIKVKSHVLISLEELRDVPLFQFDVTHKDLLKPSSNVEGGCSCPGSARWCRVNWPLLVPFLSLVYFGCKGVTVRSSCALDVPPPASGDSTLKHSQEVPSWVA